MHICNKKYIHSENVKQHVKHMDTEYWEQSYYLPHSYKIAGQRSKLGMNA